MDKTELQQKISEYFSKLPKEAQNIFSSMQWIDSVVVIATKYSLTDKQKEDLITETSMALLGIIHLDQYEENLIHEVGIQKEISDKIISDLNDNIFTSIRPELSNAFNDNIKNIAQKRYGDADKLDQRFDTLPAEVREAISNSQYQKKLYDIALKYKLGIDAMGTLDEITTRVMLGAIPSDSYGAELSKNINTPKETLDALVADVNEMVFKNIRLSLINKTKESDIDKIEANPAPIPPYKRGVPSIPNNLPILENIKANEKVMESSGVEILEDKAPEKPEKDKMTIREDSIMVKSGVSVMEDKAPQKEIHMLPNTETQKSMLSGIENPTPTKNIMDLKLNGSVTQNTTTSVHTISSNPIDTNPVKNLGFTQDPYHEAI